MLVPLEEATVARRALVLAVGLVAAGLHGERALLEVASDPLVHRLMLMAKIIRRHVHKMHAFLRFRETHDATGAERYVAWFEPEHFILEMAAPFFIERFMSMRWSILSPVGALHWNRDRLILGPPARREDAPESDVFESGWRAYYESIFNPVTFQKPVSNTKLANFTNLLN